jgi:phosphate-selective porin OprO and OprP
MMTALLIIPAAARAQEGVAAIGIRADLPSGDEDCDAQTDTTRAQPQAGNPDVQRLKKKAKKKKSDSTKDGVGLHLGKHPSLNIGSAVKVNFKARLEGDLRTATPDIGLDAAQPEWNDRRIAIEGTAFKKVEFEVARELGDDFETQAGLSQKAAWRDVYANIRMTRAFQLEGGHFKLPFGYEELKGETNRDFVYRSLAARVLSPGRDTGAMVHGQLAGRAVGYEIGYFTRDGENSRTNTTEGGHEGFAGRVVVKPFARLSGNMIAALQFGVSAAGSALEQQLGLRGRTVLGDGIFFDRVYVNGRRNRLGLDAEWGKGPLSVSTEYISVSDQRKGMGLGGDDLPDVHAAAWYVAGTWTLTGENKRGRVEPRHDLLDGGFGAVELAVRVEGLRFDDITYPGSAFSFPTPSSLLSNADHVTTFGINWYLNRYVKAQTNFVIESIEDPQRSPAPSSRGRFVSGIVRLQLAL